MFRSAGRAVPDGAAFFRFAHLGRSLGRAVV